MMKRYKLAAGDPAQGERVGLITPQRMSSLVDTLFNLKIIDVRVPLEDFVKLRFPARGSQGQQNMRAFFVHVSSPSKQP